ncbi:hypothetical protein ATL17_1603 [Maritalea mobilis]|uniref:Uncharacterized protein n=1 Tax=Maritalea mobilis TaxID=483324 RepID=A0A4R6VN30_9HYPH|nr:hypothetical protein [Maritalea mobilis]TDQ63596.1 hypothetical protein ATL17_1603 [Maritalea mobilis]
MTYISAADSKPDIIKYVKRTWPADNLKSVRPKLRRRLNTIVSKFQRNESECLHFSDRRVRSILKGEPSAKFDGYEVAAIRELLEGATDEEKEIFGQIEKLSAEIERQGQIIESLKKQMAGQGS